MLPVGAPSPRQPQVGVPAQLRETHQSPVESPVSVVMSLGMAGKATKPNSFLETGVPTPSFAKVR